MQSRDVIKKNRPKVLLKKQSGDPASRRAAIIPIFSRLYNATRDILLPGRISPRLMDELVTIVFNLVVPFHQILSKAGR